MNPLALWIILFAALSLAIFSAPLADALTHRGRNRRRK